MSPDVQERLPEYVLGTLSPSEMQEIDALVAASPALRREVDVLTEALAATAAALRPLQPSARARARLLAASIDGERRHAFRPVRRRADAALRPVGRGDPRPARPGRRRGRLADLRARHPLPALPARSPRCLGAPASRPGWSG